MAGKRITVPQKETFFTCLNEGMSVVEASRVAGFSKASGERLVARPGNGREYRGVRAERSIPDLPVPLDAVCDEARAALADRSGVLFCRRYFGYELSPFQVSVWSELEDAWDSPDRDYLCLNGPPGLGKSTVFVMFAAKRVAAWRAIRIMFMSRADSLAVKNTGRLKRALERVNPAVGAAATLSADFGRFKPRQGGDVWRRNEYVVEQMDGDPIEEKEATVTAFGFESEWLGNRIDLLFGDDLDSTRSIRNLVSVETNREVFDGELEPRIGEGGLFVIGQQRLGPTDFSAHVLSKVVLPDDDDGEGEMRGEPMYRHVTYKVHYEDRCLGVETHRMGAPAYPDGCLLDPRRMPWRDVRKAMNNPTRFKVVYQQEDADPEGTLVKPIWVEGGKDPLTGEDHPGCWDQDRGLCELPRGLDGPLLSVAVVDPSVSNYWAIQWWVYHPKSEQRFLMDCVKTRMAGNGLLDWVHDESRFGGIMEDWQRRSERISFECGANVRISTWVLEAVGAFKFLSAFSHFRRWKQLNRVATISHETNTNKHDIRLGVSTIGSHWRYGLVRLPGKNHDLGRVASLRLVDEVQRYRTDGTPTGTDDQVLAEWMFEWNLPRLMNTLPRERIELARPSYLRSGFSRSA